MPATPSLIERKQRRARGRIVRAADELFAAHGYDKVSVADIAERAEVGRTTFFRHFGDKPEVVFAKQQVLLELIAAARGDATADTPRTLGEAIGQLRPVVLDICAEVTKDPAGYVRHSQLLAQHAELQGRDALKVQQLADALDDLLVHRGCEAGTARLAAQIAVACCQAPTRLANDPQTLRADVDAALQDALSLGAPAD